MASKRLCDTQMEAEVIMEDAKWWHAAIAQKKLLTYFGCNVVSLFLLMLEMPYASVLLALAISTYQAKLIFDAHRLLRGDTPVSWVVAIFSFVIGIGFVMMIMMSGECGRTLKNAGVKSGLFGVSTEDMNAAMQAESVEKGA